MNRSHGSQYNHFILLFATGLATPCLAKSTKNIHIGLPIVAMGGEAVAKGEWRLGKMGAIGLEWTSINDVDLMTNSEKDEKIGDSMNLSGNELSLSFSRYSEPKKMSGAYWSAGLGYRMVDLKWVRSPFDGMNLEAAALNEEGKITHKINGSGMTARAKVGYRYVAESIPFAIGAYVGLRHYENALTSADSENSEVVTPTKDLEGLERRLMSALEPGIEVGLAF